MSGHPRVVRRSVQAIVEELDKRDLLEEARKVARAHHVTLAEMLGNSRSAGHCNARFELWAVLSGTLGWSTVTIGKLFGRDHTTVIAGIRRYYGIPRPIRKRSQAPAEPAKESA